MTEDEYNKLMDEFMEFCSLPPAERKRILEIEKKKYPYLYDKNYTCCFNIGIEKITYCGVDITRDMLIKLRPDRFIKENQDSLKISKSENQDSLKTGKQIHLK